ncbi:MAG: hypothetical protein FJX15_09690 [Alphaproteobacteria bacterium]|nr:hypothetical protein [Alphaproteobacteria bacterium]MBM3623953.1 hypothetical protein [Alphaproteobacteria bacterium]MBM3641594.1 hypothetical protein [Alphaproteobacteria bacterium]
MTRISWQEAIRPAAVAGMFYPADPAALRSNVDKLLADAGGSRPMGSGAHALNVMPFANEMSEHSDDDAGC